MAVSAFTDQGYGENRHAEGLAALGKIRDVLRLPLVPVGPATRAALRSALQAAGVHVR